MLKLYFEKTKRLDFLIYSNIYLRVANYYDLIENYHKQNKMFTGLRRQKNCYSFHKKEQYLWLNVKTKFMMISKWFNLNPILNHTNTN
jgi:hypothetical protein